MERSFAEAVKEKLAELGMEQEGLAKALGVTGAYISRMLTGAALPPSVTRSKIVPRMEAILGFRKGELQRIARFDRGSWQMEKARREFPDMDHEGYESRMMRSVSDYSADYIPSDA